MLFDPGVNTFRHKFWIVSTVAHDIAHQWFGDLVAPKSWDYNWMKEGLALLVGYIAADLVYPEMELKDLYSQKVLQKAFHADVLETSKAMSSEGGAPPVITSDKGEFIRKFLEQHKLSFLLFQ